ncbi:hypothetical protein IPN35_06325 [Candidatus Peregrinibacteria bacterium]|nr:MAG: hypothetical protein IPN35_06325 [Candidatus Peregrinibacteria bacterium]
MPNKKTKKIFYGTILLFLVTPCFSFSWGAESGIPPEERDQEIQSQEHQKIETLREKRRLFGENALLETEIRMLEYRLGEKSEAKPSSFFPSNIGIDRSGALFHFFGDSFSWIENLQKMTQDASGQAGNESLSMPPLSEDVLILIRQSIERFRMHTGHYPQTLEDFLQYPNEEWANIFFARQNRNIAEFSGELSYSYNSGQTKGISEKTSPVYVFSCFSYFTNICETYFSEGEPTKKEDCSRLLTKSPDEKTTQKLRLLIEKKQTLLASSEDENQREKTAKIIGTVLQEANINCCREVSFLANSGESCGPQVAPGEKNETFSLSLTTLPERVSLENIEGAYPKKTTSEIIKSKAYPLFRNIPEDDLVVSFTSGSDLLQLFNSISPLSDSIKTVLPIPSLTETQETIEKRLGIKNLPELLRSSQEVALVFEDTSWISGGDYALIIQPKTSIEDVWASVFRTGENSFGRMGRYVVIASHDSLFERIKKAYGGIVPNMENSVDFSKIIKTLDNRRNGEVIVSTAFLKKISDPEYHIKSQRRRRVLSAEEALQYLVWGYWKLEGILPVTLSQVEDRKYIAEGSVWNPEAFSIGEDGVIAHETWGSLFHPTPLGRVSLKTATRAEISEYEHFRKTFQSLFANHLESLGVGIVISDHIAFDTVFFSQENETRNIVKNALSGSETSWFGIQDSGMTDSVFRGEISVDFSTLLAEMGVGFSGAFRNTPNETRENDLLVLHGVLQKYKTENGYYPSSLETLVETGYMGSTPHDPDGNPYEYTSLPNTDSGVQDQCYRLSARLNSEESQKMESDGGLDPNALETGECFLGHSFPEQSLRNEEGDASWRETAAGIFREWLSQRFSIPSLVGIFGSLKNEVYFGVHAKDLWGNILSSSPTVPLLDRFSNLFFVAIPLKKSSDGENILQNIAKNNSAEKREFENTWYIAVPKSNLLPPFFLGIQNNTLFLSLQEDVLQETLLQKNSSFPLQRSRAFLPENILSFSDFSLQTFGATFDTPAGKTFLHEALHRQIRYLQEAIEMAKILPEHDGSMKNVSSYYKNIPQSVFDWDVIVNSDTLFFRGNQKQVSCDADGCYRKLGQLIPEPFFDDFFLENTSFDSFKKTLSNYSDIAIGFRFSETEANFSIAFKNPLWHEPDTRFSLPDAPKKLGIISKTIIPMFSPARYGDLLFENLSPPIRIILIGIGGTIVAILIGFFLSPAFWRKEPSQKEKNGGE